jgi:hypothetical protein
MWMNQQPRRDTAGKRWNFRIWYDVWTEEKVFTAQRLFFWDDEKNYCGVVLFPPGSTVHFSRLKKLIEKLVADPALRRLHRRDLSFPLERHYAGYGTFPEEKPN